MLFAAGFGTRMGVLTANQPKPLIKVAGKSLIDHTLDIVADAEINNIVVNTHYLPEMMENHLSGRDITLSNEPDKILETGGGLRHALPLLGKDPVFTFNSDAIWAGPNPLTMLAASWNPAKMDALLLLTPRTDKEGDFELAPDGRISRKGDLLYSGAQIIKTDGLAEFPQPAFSLNLLWDNLIAKRRAYGVIYQGGWCDVGTSEGIKAAEDMLTGSENV